MQFQIVICRNAAAQDKTPFSHLTAHVYYDQEVPTPGVPEDLLRKLLLKATTEVEFSFNSIIFKQTDGVAMGSPLGPTLANIFVGYLESKIAI